MITAPHLAKLAAAYTAATGTSFAAIGVQIFNDHRFFKRLASGLDCTTQSAAKATAWFIANWPDKVPWPDDVPRPAAPAAAA